MKYILATFITICVWTMALNVGLAADDPQLQFTRINSRGDVWDIANANDGSGRLFLVRRWGVITIMEDGQELPTHFLNIQNRVVDRGDEMGLLSMAFSPDYETSGNFYVLYVGDGSLILDRFKVSDDPNIADPLSRRMVFSVILTSWTNNGGRIQFGPDGMLYLGIGDDGDYEGYDTTNPQDGSNVFGKILRVDVDPVHDTYAIPPDNPFIGNAAFRDEIWAFGLRNPYRISFDENTGDVFIADVGQEQMQEIDVQPFTSTGGENYGWNIKEGSLCVPGQNCNQAGLTDPVAEYPNVANSGADNCWVLGGEVYRGDAYPNLDGTYLYADYCSGRLWGLKRAENQWVNTLLSSTPYNITAFGRGEDGSVYMAVENAGVFVISDGPVVSEPEFPINAGHSGAWFNPQTSGQGQLLDIDPANEFMFLSWFTYTDDTSANPNEQHWFTAQGNFSGDSARLTLYESLGGRFDDSQAVSTDPVGEVEVNFSDCDTGEMSYIIDSSGLQGSFPLERVIPGSGNICEERDAAAFAIESVDINAGMDGAWYETTTPGQGFLIDVHPNPAGGNFIFVAWFTYGDSNASGQRWLTAQGTFTGPLAEIDVYESTGGSFDESKAVTTTRVGTMNIEFTDCTHATLNYSLPGEAAEGEIDLIRVMPDGGALCTTLAE